MACQGPRRTWASRRAAQRRARASLEGALRRRAPCGAHDPLGVAVPAAVALEVARREQIARPALLGQISGQGVPHSRILRRNVALHAERCPRESEHDSAFRQAQRGPRLGAQVARRAGPVIPAVAALFEHGPPGPPPLPPPEEAADAFLGERWDSRILERFLLQPGHCAQAPAVRPCRPPACAGEDAMQARLSRWLRAAPWRNRTERHYIVVEVPVPVPAVQYVVIEVTDHEQLEEMNVIKKQLEEVAVVNQRIEELAAIKKVQADEMAAMGEQLDQIAIMATTATMKEHHDLMAAMKEQLCEMVAMKQQMECTRVPVEPDPRHGLPAQPLQGRGAGHVLPPANFPDVELGEALSYFAALQLRAAGAKQELDVAMREYDRATKYVPSERPKKEKALGEK